MKKLLANVFNKWLSLPPQPAPIIVHEKEVPLLEQVDALLNIVDVYWFLTYTPKTGQGVVVNTLYPRIGEYTEAIHSHLDFMRQDNPVLESRCQRKSSLVPVNKFFLTADGYHENAHDHVYALREASLKLCAQLRDYKENPSSLGKYNLRLLTPLLENLKVIFGTLCDLKAS